MKNLTSFFYCVLFGIVAAGTTHAQMEWKTHRLSGEFFGEGATAGDFNRDGHVDVASGPWWYAGPDWKKKHAFYKPNAFSPYRYSDNFFAFTEDFNNDGWDDILVFGFPGQDASWYENPGDADRPWSKHQVLDRVDNESPTFVDITGDGRRDIVCSSDGFFGYAEINAKDPADPWRFIRISDQAAGGKFTHGLGVGDVNRDGRLDLLEKNGWWEQPASLGVRWKQHRAQFGRGHGPAQICVYDVDGDGDNDIVSSLEAHGFGLAWYENSGDSETFKRHLIMDGSPNDNEFGVVFSQLHALALADLDGDGLKDIVTGKRYWAHGPSGDVQPTHAPVLYWFQLQRTEDGEVRWIPHLVDDSSGVGVEVDVMDVNGDKLPDIVVGNKKGTFVHTQHQSKIAVADSGRLLTIGESERARPGKKKDGQPSAAGLTPEEATAAMTVPKGFQVQLAAGEPMVHQPVAMTFDHRGRLWLAEAYEYPIRAPEGQGKDKILILEDTDQDGAFDKRTVFADNLNLISGLEVGFGGVWVGAAPYFMFIPDRDGDDRPDGEPQILLDGFNLQDTHETLNAFNWGPDGWLYGCHGIFNNSRVGTPDSNDEQRILLTGGVWRYHPTRHKFEVVARGTSNPWGVDFNDYGHAFITACVIPHMYHIIPGGRYQRQGGQHLNPYTYDDLKTIADHAHYSGNVQDHAWWGRNENVQDDSTDAAGGGHAHCGALIYLGNNWPSQYRNSIFMTNLLGNRLNNDTLHRVGSGYVASHAPDFLFANDQWFRCINQRLAPDGSVYLIDWYDKQACHRNDRELWDRTNGRVYRVAFGHPKSSSVDLSKLSDTQLAELQLYENEWQVRVSRRLLQERAHKNQLDEQAVRKVLEPILESHDSVPRRLRAVWTLHACEMLTENDRLALLNADGHKSEYLRSWAVQLDGEDGRVDDLEQLASMAANDDSQLVRLYLASLLQRLDLDERWDIAKGLLSHPQDAGDQNLPLMVWYGIEPLVAADVNQALELAREARIPVVQRYIYRRAAEQFETTRALMTFLKSVDDAKVQKQVVEEITAALSRQANSEMPPEWPDVYAKLATSEDAELLDQARAISVKFGDASVFPALRQIVEDSDASVKSRKNALETLVNGKDEQLVPVLLTLIDDKNLRSIAISAAANYEDERLPTKLLAEFSSFSSEQKSAAIATLAGRLSSANKMLDAIGNGDIERDQLTAFTVRQLLLFKSGTLTAKLENVWGKVAPSSEGKRRQIEHLIEQLTPETLVHADLSQGRATYEKNCAKCHKLFGAGGEVGPDITGSNRANLDYILHNIVDPSALVGKDYQTTQLLLEDGRIVAGLVQDETDGALTIHDGNKAIVVNKNEIDERSLTATSMMPEGQLDNLKPDQIRDLIAYLGSPSQVPLPGEGPVFNNRTRSVAGALEAEDLEIVSKTKGSAVAQDMSSFANDRWSKDRQLWWTQATPGDSLSFKLPVPRDGEFEIFVAMTKAVDYGIVQFKLNDKPIGEKLDLYATDVISTGPLSLGKRNLRGDDTNLLEVKIVGANPSAVKSYMFGLDYVYLGKSANSIGEVK